MQSAVVHTVHIGFLLVFVLLILTASVTQQDLPLFGHCLGGRLAHCTLSTHFPVIITVIYVKKCTLHNDSQHDV